MALLRVGGFAFLITAWALGSTMLHDVQLPPPTLALQALRDNFFEAPGLQLMGLEGGYLTHILYTVGNSLTAFIVGGVLGMAVGLMAARVQLARDASAPLLLLFATVPELVAAPFFLIWFGPNRLGQAVLVGFYTFVVISIASENAGLRLAPRYDEFAATLGAGRLRRFLTVVMPGALPATIGAVRVALAISWSLQTAGELLGSQQGVGRVIVLSQHISFTAGTLAVITLMGLIAVAIDFVVASLLRWLGRWREAIA